MRFVSKITKCICVCSVWELTEQLERMESDQNEAKEKIQEYQAVTKRYEQEIVTMKEKMANLLNKSDPGLRRNSHRIDNIELHNVTNIPNFVL